MSKGCLSQKYGPVLTDLCLAERIKEEHTLFPLALVVLLVFLDCKGLSDFRELDFVHLVGIEHGIWKCCNVCQL